MRRTKLKLTPVTRPPRADWLPRPQRSAHSATWARWEAAGRRFKGLDIGLETAMALRHISFTPAGYHVRIYRDGRIWFRGKVRGHSEESLLEAMRIRDEALRSAPSRRSNEVPRSVLRALGLSEPVPGICRLPSRSSYRVYYTDEAGRKRLRGFYYRVVSEVDAYAAAIEFRQWLMKNKSPTAPGRGGPRRATMNK